MKPCVSQRFVAFQAKPRLARHVDVNPELGVRGSHLTAAGEGRLSGLQRDLVSETAYRRRTQGKVPEATIVPNLPIRPPY